LEQGRCVEPAEHGKHQDGYELPQPELFQDRLRKSARDKAANQLLGESRPSCFDPLEHCPLLPEARAAETRSDARMSGAISDNARECFRW
jgi:hypothetical protein